MEETVTKEAAKNMAQLSVSTMYVLVTRALDDMKQKSYEYINAVFKQQKQILEILSNNEQKLNKIIDYIGEKDIDEKNDDKELVKKHIKRKNTIHSNVANRPFAPSILKILSILDAEEQSMFKLRYGFEGNQKTYDEVAQLLSFSRSYVENRLNKMLWKMKYSLPEIVNEIPYEDIRCHIQNIK